jgi:hypothetical protein
MTVGELIRALSREDPSSQAVIGHVHSDRLHISTFTVAAVATHPDGRVMICDVDLAKVLLNKIDNAN